ncbi:hypothetical protein FB451DRAFT_55492 [Mycena latifolia]|nr:hypothetical protein FB451DRAFT_55492 [Mycena latifolia]
MIFLSVFGPGSDVSVRGRPCACERDDELRSLSCTVLNARMTRLETAVSTDISSGRHEARKCVGLIAEVLQKSHSIQLARLKRLENILGMGLDMQDDKTLLNRFDLLSFAVEDLLERVKDPEANVPVPIHHGDESPKTRLRRCGYPAKNTQPGTSNILHIGPSSPIDIFSDNSVSTAVDESIQNIISKLPEFDDPIDQDVVPDSPVIVHRYTPRNNFAAVAGNWPSCPGCGLARSKSLSSTPIYFQSG